ncbi:MAG: cell division protein FtsZ [Tannerella sp.]|nr:cell division protein FtsZ [Tannerella sp.]
MSRDNKKLSEIIPFKFPVDARKIIKVIGVGGGGGNAVKHMYREGIHDVSFVLCNTDWQDMQGPEVPDKIVLGPTVTKGLGAGNDPKKAEEAARESEEDIRSMLNDGTQMVFITATMGGGTGTGSAPVIAGIAKDMGILTVGIVTIPFLFEGYDKIIQALDGVEEMSKNVDALLVVNNERLSELYREERYTRVSVRKAYARANNTLTVAAKGISEVITLAGEMNLDFADVEKILKNGGIAMMSSGYGEGENRLEVAIKDALNSPLLSYNDFNNAKKILFQITSSSDEQYELGIDEVEHVRKFMGQFEKYIEVIWGLAYDDSLDEKVKFTLLASGFGLEGIDGVLSSKEREEIIRKKGINIEQKEKRIKRFYILQDKSDNLMARIVVLTEEEMENDSFLHWLEEHPVCDREPEEIAEARIKKVSGASSSRTSASPSEANKPPSIKF